MKLLWMVLLLLLLAACQAPASQTAVVAAAPTTVPAAGLVELEKLPVKGKASATGYTRVEFGRHWLDPDHNGCDARRDTLARQAVDHVVRVGPHQCVLTATILDPYTGQRISSRDADTDHVVALGDAWQTGAQQLSAVEREALANDPDELVATTAALNRAKGDRDASGWLPPNESYRCAYVTAQITVKARYRLWVTAAEQAAMRDVLEKC